MPLYELDSHYTVDENNQKKYTVTLQVTVYFVCVCEFTVWASSSSSHMAYLHILVCMSMTIRIVLRLFLMP